MNLPHRAPEGSEIPVVPEVLEVPEVPNVPPPPCLSYAKVPN